MPLLRSEGPMGHPAGAAPVGRKVQRTAGFVTFSYELAPLMMANDDLLAVFRGAAGSRAAPTGN